MEKILKGIRVLDFTDAISGPYCTKYLADCGAEVINIDMPGGKSSWRVPYIYKGQSVNYLYNHCNKKSLGIDMKKEGSREIIIELVKVCDVFVENFRPGVMKGFGLDYASLQEINPSIIMCSISGWGQDGPYADRMGADITATAESGILDLTGERDGYPSLIAFPITDFVGALNAFGAICAALYRRVITGEGEYIDISLMNCSIAVLQQAVGQHVLSGGTVEMHRSGRFDPDNSIRGIYKGNDGYIVISSYTNVGFTRLSELMGRPELAEDPRFKTNQDRLKNDLELANIVEDWLSQFEKVEEAAMLLQSYRIMASPIRTVAQVIKEDPQFKVSGMLKELEHRTLGKVKFLDSPLKFKHTAASITEAPPASPGENTATILETVLKLNNKKIEELKAGGIVFESV